MKLTTPAKLADYFYLSISTKNTSQFDELLGISIGRFYFGFYGTNPHSPNHLDRFCFAKLDANGCIP